MKNILIIAVSIALSVVVTTTFFSGSKNPRIEQKDTAYERVIRTNTLRCGFGSWEPGIIRNPRTNEMEGLFVEMLSEIAKIAKLNIEWTQEVDWGQISVALQSQKVDAFCAGMAADAVRAKKIAYTKPLSFWRFDAIVRADDKRFPENTVLSIDDFNKSAFKTSYTEGDVLETIKQTELPLTQGIPLPPLGTPADNLANVLTGKTDFVVFPRVMLQNYKKTNPDGNLRFVELKTPLRLYGNVLAVDIHEQELRSFLDAAITEFVQSGSYKRIMEKYNGQYPLSFLSVADQYKENAN